MLILDHNGLQYPILQDDYFIKEQANGLDELHFSISIWDDIYTMIYEEARITDRGGQTYLVKQIDGGADTAAVVAQLDLDAWRAEMQLDYSNDSDTVYNTITAIKPSGWYVIDYSGSTIHRTIQGNLTPLDVCFEACNTYGVYIRWDNALQACYIYPQTIGAPVGAFATRELNLREINYKGKSTDFATRLYAYGKKGPDDVPLTIQGATIHGEVYPYPYVQNTSYANKIVSVYWQDDRYTDAESLYDDAVAKLAEMAAPVRCYDCSIVDLKATNPDTYGNLDFSLFTAATLIDDTKGTAVNYQVVERHIYPYYPEKNEVIFNSEPLKITGQVIQLADSINAPDGEFRATMEAAIANATKWLTSSGGYVEAVQNTDGSWKELLFMDTNSTATATNVLRMNTNGIGFSTTGVNGPYTNAWTIDGSLVADFITTGTLNAANVNVINLNASNITTGTLSAERIDIKGKVITGDTRDDVVLTTEYSIVDPEHTGDENEIWYYDMTLSAAVTAATVNVPYINYSSTSQLANDGILVRQESNGQTDYVYMYASNIELCNSDGSTVTTSSVRAGQAQFTVSTSTASDERLKHDIEDIAPDKAKSYIMGIRPRAFKYNNGTHNRPHHGVVAQELIEAMGGEDWGVYYQDDNGYYAVRYEEIIADLIAVVQDQERRIAALERGADDGK